MAPRTFFFRRGWHGAASEPHVVIVRHRGEIETRYNSSETDVIEVPFTGRKWERFLHCAGDALGIGNRSELVLVEVISDRASRKPIILYVRDTIVLAKECGDELARFMAFWEEFALYGAAAPQPMLLALQFPERGQ